MKKPVQKFNLSYTALRPIVEFATRSHYNRFITRGKENIPSDGNIIIAPNHQNALMDTLLLLCTRPAKSIVYLCRADIFANPTIANILHWLKILPVYRIRDGKENLSKNEEIFNLSKHVIIDKVPLCLFAEGKHNNKHQMLPLVKGMFRIAGETQKELNDKPLYIVPTGIDYDDYERPQSNAIVTFGKPIDIRPFMEMYNENEPAALNAMRDTLAASLKLEMHHIGSTDFYDEFYMLSKIFNNDERKRLHRTNTVWNRFITRKEITANLDRAEQEQHENLPKVVELVREYQAKCQKAGLREELVSERWGWLKLSVVTLIAALLIASLVLFKPVRMAALALVICFPLILLPTHLISRKIIKDTQFRSSINFAIRFGVSLIYTLALWIFAATKGWAILLATIIGTLAIIYFSGNILRGLKSLSENWKFVFHRCFKASKTKQLLQLKKTLYEAYLVILDK